MKILQLSHKVPFPPKDGGCIAINNLTQGMINEGHEVNILAINTPKHFTDISKLPVDYLEKTKIETVFIDTDVKIVAAFKNLFTNASYNIQRFYSKAFEKKLIELLKLKQYDIVQLESLYVSIYADTIRKNSTAKIVLRSHNIEHQLWERNAKITTNPIKKWYLNLLATRLKKYELTSLKSVDAIASITKIDEEYFKNQNCTIPIATFPFGIDVKKSDETSEQIAPLSIFHIGAMDWLPNIEGINWFLKNVWIKVQDQHPDTKLYLAGKSMPQWLMDLKQKNVIVKGEVKNAQNFISDNSIMVVPLLSGGGMRVKIIEGMALGKTIISTTLGAEGINYTKNKNIVIADDAVSFQQAISKCISDQVFREELGKNAKMLILSEYNNVDICKRLTLFYNQLIKNQNA